MPKRIAVAMLLPLAACTPEGDPPQRIGMPNPASAHCIDVGGRLEIRKDANGAETGYCHLPGGEIIEEWVLFRRANASDSKE